MPRRVRRALLVALAALAGCRLAAPGGSTCINSCYCHLSASTTSPPPLLGAAPPPLHTQGQDDTSDCKHCKVIEAIFGAEGCPPRNATVQLQEIWDQNWRKIRFAELEEDPDDPCPGSTKYLRITTAATEEGDIQREWKGFTSKESLDMTECCLNYPPPLPPHRSTPGHECLGNLSKLDWSALETPARG